jgi:hypothetical protein
MLRISIVYENHPLGFREVLIRCKRYMVVDTAEYRRIYWASASGYWTYTDASYIKEFSVWEINTVDGTVNAPRVRA